MVLDVAGQTFCTFEPSNSPDQGLRLTEFQQPSDVYGAWINECLSIIERDKVEVKMTLKLTKYI